MPSAVVSTTSVHPHTRGEIDNRLQDEAEWDGSPPHAWGDCKQDSGPCCGERFTPTRVGRFIHPAILPSLNTVHPHTRGEIEELVPIPICECGSPPHAWGDFLLSV